MLFLGYFFLFVVFNLNFERCALRKYEGISGSLKNNLKDVLKKYENHESNI